MDFMTALISFLAGGGLFKAYSLWNNRKAAKLDTADRIIEFYQKQAEQLISRIEAIEQDVSRLKEISCIRFDCKERIPSK